VDLPCQFRPPRSRRGPASAHSHTSPDFSATTPTHAPSSLLRAPLVPRARLPPHFAQLRPLSRSVHVVSHPKLTRDRTRPPQALPRGETPAPRACFTLFAPAFSQFGLADVWSRLLAALARCPAIPTSSSAWALAQGVPPPLLELARALSRPIAPSGGQDSSPELLRPARDLPSAVLPSLPSDSWPFPRH
jgi:hypothetical protein